MNELQARVLTILSDGATIAATLFTCAQNYFIKTLTASIRSVLKERFY